MKKIEKFVSKYFLKTKKIIEDNNPDTTVLVQYFQRNDNVILSGIKFVLEFLEKHTKTKKYSIKYLKDGSQLSKNEVVLELEGNYKYFGIYEGIIDGILCRNSSIATKAYLCTKAASNKPIIFMADRNDMYFNQAYDGYSAHIGGINVFSTTENTKYILSENSKQVFGSIPHILIQNFDGNLEKALIAYKNSFPDDKIISLVDFDNDVISGIKKSYQALGKELYGIRIDTSISMKDKMFSNDQDEYGVTVNMIKNVKKFLNENDMKHVKIIVSSGFDVNRIKEFESDDTPVDMYGVGAYLLEAHNVNFTCDAVKINDKFIAKQGRGFNNNPKLIKYSK